MLEYFRAEPLSILFGTDTSKVQNLYSLLEDLFAPQKEAYGGRLFTQPNVKGISEPIFPSSLFPHATV